MLTGKDRAGLVDQRDSRPVVCYATFFDRYSQQRTYRTHPSTEEGVFAWFAMPRGANRQMEKTHGKITIAGVVFLFRAVYPVAHFRIWSARHE